MMSGQKKPFTPPILSPVARAAAEKYLARLEVDTRASDDPKLILKTLAEGEFARRLVRQRREHYHEMLGYGAAVYIKIDGHPRRELIMNECAAELGSRRVRGTNDIGLVLRRVIGYGGNTQKEREQQRQFWSRDAAVVLKLLNAGATPDEFPDKLKKLGGLKKCAADPGKVDEAARPASGPRAPRNTSPLRSDLKKLLKEAGAHEAVVACFLKKPNGDIEYGGGITLGPLPKVITEVPGWKQLERDARRLKAGFPLSGFK